MYFTPHSRRKQEWRGTQALRAPGKSLPFAHPCLFFNTPSLSITICPGGHQDKPQHVLLPFLYVTQGSRSFLLTPAPDMTLSIPSLPPFPPAQLLNLCGFLNSCPSAARSSIFAIPLTLCFTFLFSPKRRLSSLPPALLLKSPACALCQPTPTRSHRAREPTGAVPAEDPSP